MEKKKLKLTDLKIQSFVTETSDAMKRTINGGQLESAGTMCLVVSLCSPSGCMNVNGCTNGPACSDVACTNPTQGTLAPGCTNPGIC